MTRLKLGTTAFLSTKTLGKTKTKNIVNKKQSESKGKLIYKYKQKKRGRR